jgi:hypothetical protein
VASVVIDVAYTTICSPLSYKCKSMYSRYPHYDSKASFSDFSSFGGWSSPAIKQVMYYTYITISVVAFFLFSNVDVVYSTSVIPPFAPWVST